MRAVADLGRPAGGRVHVAVIILTKDLDFRTRAGLRKAVSTGACAVVKNPQWGPLCLFPEHFFFLFSSFLLVSQRPLSLGCGYVSRLSSPRSSSTTHIYRLVKTTPRLFCLHVASPATVRAECRSIEHDTRVESACKVTTLDRSLTSFLLISYLPTFGKRKSGDLRSDVI